MSVEVTKTTIPKKQIRRKDSEIIAALKATSGLIFLAARELGIAPSVIYRRRDKSKAVAECIESQRGELLDIAEIGLKKQILEGNVTAMIWVTKTLGKQRGYVERSEVVVRTWRDELLDLLKQGKLTVAEVRAELPAPDADELIAMAGITVLKDVFEPQETVVAENVIDGEAQEVA